MILIIGITNNSLKAQNKKGKADDLGRIVLNSYVSPQVEGLPSSAKRMLNNKLSQIASKNGMGGSALVPRFIITPNITVLTKDITSTAPPMFALTLEFTLYIGDGIEGTKFASTSIEAKGVGKNETKAYMDAIKRINPNNPIIQDFIKQGENRIIEYYNSRCDFILKEARTLEAQNKFEEAILKLNSVPEVCKDCFDKCMDAVGSIYQKYIDRECKLNLAKAINAWNSGQDINAANAASKYLAVIDPSAACFNEAKSLSDKIAKRVSKLDQRQWDFKLKQQQDDVDIRKYNIKAARDVGVAYGNNQPQNITYNTRGWW